MLNSPKDLEQLLDKARDAYYNTGESIMSDEEYDLLQESTGKANPIGAKPRQDTRFPVLKHQIPMCSLNKAKNQNEVDGWIQAMKIDPSVLVCERKYDGLSLSVTYGSDCQIESAILRGDGIEGENVVENAKKFIPEISPKLAGIRHVIRGEVVISKTNFEKLPKDEYKNRRNCVSGIIRRLDGKHCELLDFVCYDIILPDHPEAMKQEIVKLGSIKQLQRFKVAQVWHYSPQVLLDLEKERDGEYLIDGVVIKHNDSVLAQKVGRGANGNPLLQIAYKFPSEAGVTYVTDVKWEIGETRKFTPVCEIEPITIQGSTIGRVSLASYNQFKKLQIARNKKVFVRRIHDVIPQISASNTAKLVQDRELESLKVPEICPHCGTKIDIRVNEKGEETDIFCSNENCPEALTMSLSKNLKTKLKTKGFGESVCRQLVSSGIVGDLFGVYSLTAEQVCANTNMSLDRSTKFVGVLKESLNSCKPEIFIDLFGFDGISEKSLRDLTSKYTIPEILDLDLDSCIQYLKRAKGTSFYEQKEKFKDQILQIWNLRTK